MLGVPDATFIERFAVALDAALYYRGRTMADLAAALGLDVETVRRWRRGDNTPKLAEVARIADVLGVPDALLLRPPADRARALALIADHDDRLRGA